MAGAGRVDAVEGRVGADRRRAARPRPRERVSPVGEAGMHRRHRAEAAAAGARARAARRCPRSGSRQKTPGRWVTQASSMPTRSIAASSASGEVPGTRRKGYAPRNALTSMRISRRGRRRRERSPAALRQRTRSSSAARKQVLEIAELGPAGLDRQVAAPEQPLDADRLEAGLEHAAVHPAAGEVDEDVRQRRARRQRVQPVAAAADVRQEEAHLRMARGQPPELDARRTPPAPDSRRGGAARCGAGSGTPRSAASAADADRAADRRRGGWRPA